MEGIDQREIEELGEGERKGKRTFFFLTIPLVRSRFLDGGSDVRLNETLQIEDSDSCDSRKK